MTPAVDATDGPDVLDAAVIGTGFSGLGMACRLKQQGIEDFVVFERAQEVGGTWRDNTYPGCACDIRSDLYSFSFAPNPDWTSRYARQEEIHAYLRDTTDRFGIREHIRFGHEVEHAAWDEEAALWRITTSAGEYLARVLISGHGPLITPKWPEIPGLEDFAGESFHSAAWNHGVELAGKRIAVIGTGASAIQFVPRIAESAGQLTVFQRSAPWVMPRGDAPTSAARRRWFARLPLLQQASRAWIFGVAESRFAGFKYPWVSRRFEAVGRSYLARKVRDPELRAKVTPDFRIGCKRLLVSDEYYPALNRPNVDLVTEKITGVTATGVVTADGAHHEVDVLICGTGFNATQPAVAELIHGRGGIPLAQYWGTRMEALHGTTVTGFPNLFLLVGPNTALGHNSIVYIIESQIDYVLKALRLMRGRGAAAIEALPQAQSAYNDGLQRTLSTSVWVKGGCTSFYLDAEGRNTTLWPHRAARFRQLLRRFDPSLYRLTTARQTSERETRTHETETSHA
ncbi:flavin-containing monooxygenase [Streptacidiphilus sp. PAMC 29251]